MKTLYFISITFLYFLGSCNSGIETNGHKVTFGIYEVIKTSEVPNAIIDTLKSSGVQIESNQHQSVIGYITKADSIFIQIDLSGQNLQLVKTVYPVDKEQKNYALVAIRTSSIINNSHIKKTKVNGNSVEIYFNYEGAKKWADLTKKSIGNQVAFIIDNQIYTITSINNEIKNGVARINGFNTEMEAKNISEALNSSIHE